MSGQSGRKQEVESFRRRIAPDLSFLEWKWSLFGFGFGLSVPSLSLFCVQKSKYDEKPFSWTQSENSSLKRRSATHPKLEYLNLNQVYYLSSYLFISTNIRYFNTFKKIISEILASTMCSSQRTVWVQACEHTRKIWLLEFGISLSHTDNDNTFIPWSFIMQIMPTLGLESSRSIHWSIYLS
jgi:hypothetical protein